MAYHFAEPERLSGRALAIAGILALHVLAAYLLATGLVQTVLHDKGKSLSVIFIREPEPPRVPPTPVTKVDFTSTRVPAERLPVPRLPDPPPDVQPSPAAESANAPTPAVAPATPDAIRILGKNQMPDTQDYYPPALIREGIGGAAYVRVCVDEAGQRHGDPTIEQSSGNAQLDLGALNVARHGRYARAVQGSTPVPYCYRFHIAFRFR
jgi:TonB family protein